MFVCKKKFNIFSELYCICKKCEIKFKLCILCLLKIICLKMMSHAVNKKAFYNGSKSVEDEKKSILKHFNLSKKSEDDISI